MPADGRETGAKRDAMHGERRTCKRLYPGPCARHRHIPLLYHHPNKALPLANAASFPPAPWPALAAAPAPAPPAAAAAAHCVTRSVSRVCRAPAGKTSVLLASSPRPRCTRWLRGERGEGRGGEGG